MEKAKYYEEKRRLEDISKTVAEANDRFRCHAEGRGEVVIDSSIYALGADFVSSLLKEIANFDNFTKDTDPIGEHDTGEVKLHEHTFIWQFNYFDLTEGKYVYDINHDIANDESIQRILRIRIK